MSEAFSKVPEIKPNQSEAINHHGKFRKKCIDYMVTLTHTSIKSFFTSLPLVLLL